MLHAGLPGIGNKISDTLSSWKGWDVTDNKLIGDGGFDMRALSGLVGGMSLGTLHEQRFFALRASGGELRFPFPRGPFTVFVDIAGPVEDAALGRYAEALISHGCVQAVCRGEDSDRLVDIFNALAERGELDADGVPFTAMGVDEEPLEEAIEYFVLPCGLAQTGLVMVIGDQGDFRNAIRGFSSAAGAAREDIGEPVYTEDDLVCFV